MHTCHNYEVVIMDQHFPHKHSKSRTGAISIKTAKTVYSMMFSGHDHTYY